MYTQKEIDWMESTSDPDMRSLLYNGRRGIRKCGIGMMLTDLEIAGLIEYGRNTVAFIHEHGIIYSHGNRCRPVLTPQQEKIMVDHETERFYPVFSERQSGLTTSIQFMVLHDLIFKGVTDAVICCTSRKRSADIIGKVMEMYSELPFYMKPGVRKMEADRVVFENGSRISTCPPGRHMGRNIESLYIDDFQHMDRSSIEGMLNNWLPVMLAMTTTKVFIGCSGSIPTALRDHEFFTLFRCGEIDWVKVK